MKVTAPPTPTVRSLQEICQAARQANCGECWQKPGKPCAHDPEGDHVARFGRAARRGLITGPELEPGPRHAAGLADLLGHDADRGELGPCEAVTFHSLIPGHLRLARLGDQACQCRDHRRDLRSGELGYQVRGWRRSRVRQQTELGGLHDCPPWPVAFVQPAPAHPGHGRKTPKPVRTRSAGRPPAPASPCPCRRGLRRRQRAGWSTPPGSAACCHQAAPAAAPAARAGASRPAPAAPARPAGDAGA